MFLKLSLPLASILAGCAREADCVLLKPMLEVQNHVQVFDLALDLERRRVYSSALASRAVLVYDADTFEVIEDLPLGTTPAPTPAVEVDRDGHLWVAANAEPALRRYSAEDGARRVYWEEIDGARAVAARASGGVVVLGRDDVSNNTLMAMDADGELVIRADVEQAASGLFALDEGERVAAALNAGEIAIYDSESLEELERCPLAFSMPWDGAQLDDGSIVVASAGAVGLAGCGERAAVAWRVGVENMEVLSLGDRAVVLDRIGSGEGVDPNLGLARSFDASGQVGEFATGKNTGFGAWDAQADQLWLNSEGSSETWVVDPQTGDALQTISVGTFLDGLALDPERSQVLYVTGRLSDTLVRVEGGGVTAASSQVHWPFSPVVDVERDLLWVLEHTESRILGLDRDNLSIERSIDPGLGPNTLLSFGNIMLHTTRGTLFFAESQHDLLLELDPDSGQEIGRWELGGPAIEDPDQVGELALRMDPDEGVVFLARSTDARVQRVDPDAGELLTAFLPDEVLEQLRVGHSTDFLRHFSGDGLLYVGGAAVKMDSLERWEERDLPVTRLVGRHPRHDDQWIAVDDQRRRLVRVDEQGEILGSLPFAANELHATVVRVGADTNEVYMTRALHGNVCAFPVRWLR